MFYILIVFTKYRPISSKFSKDNNSWIVVIWKQQKEIKYKFCADSLIVGLLLGLVAVTGRLPEHDRHTASFSVRSQSVLSWQRSDYCGSPAGQARPGKAGEGWMWHETPPVCHSVTVTLAPPELELYLDNSTSFLWASPSPSWRMMQISTHSWVPQYFSTRSVFLSWLKNKGLFVPDLVWWGEVRGQLVKPRHDKCYMRWRWRWRWHWDCINARRQHYTQKYQTFPKATK